MRKFVALCLMVWLPCFLLAAQAISMQMQLANLTVLQTSMIHMGASSNATLENAMPCHDRHIHAAQKTTVSAIMSSHGDKQLTPNHTHPMQFEIAQANHHQASDNLLSDNLASGHQAGPDACQVCGFCLMATHVVDVAPPHFVALVLPKVTPRFFPTPVTSRELAPTIKPPISA